MTQIFGTLWNGNFLIFHEWPKNDNFRVWYWLNFLDKHCLVL